MNTHLISYDLGGPEKSSDYKKIHDYIENFSRWAKPLESLFLVVSNKSTGEIRTELGNITDSNDKILVINVRGDDWATNHMPSEINEWMQNNVKNYN